MIRRKPRRAELTAWQKHALSDLRSISVQQPDDLRLIGELIRDSEGNVGIILQLQTSELSSRDTGLRLQRQEQFVLWIPPSPLHPPRVEVEHLRFAGYPHVLQGYRLCIYLDPSREWDPVGGGIRSCLNRLWSWLSDAISDRFDASTAMYHAVGGVLHWSPGTPTLVIREPGPFKKMQVGYLIPRSEYRLDLTYDPRRIQSGMRLPVITVETALPFGAGDTLAEVLKRLDDPFLGSPAGYTPRHIPQSPAVLTALAASAAKNPRDMPQYLVLAVPHPAGGPPHLLGARIPASAANVLRRLAKQHASMIRIDPAAVSPDLQIEWCRVSDERPAVTTRRDDSRPVNSFQGKRVHIWGCGGIGSWIAEFVTRAGAAHITLCDPGAVTGGLLVRQNYVETDVGKTKVAALGQRLRAISDDVVIDVADDTLPMHADKVVMSVDVVIDATVSVAVGQRLELLAALSGRTATLAQVATDTRTGTLGILTVSGPGYGEGPLSIDKQTGESVLANQNLELYHALWRNVLDGDELVPTRGCSVPTFHGSSADLAAVAATLVTFLGMHLSIPASGTHLIALPHAGGGPHHHFIAHTT
ncbi:ThiF family adenylyltransferase [Microtetraspora sp. AC03309]|uniref:ThiF family adenylyltransferase n=1 Tax=Microtetraspora sp. AC03309 TaxID=2779376 RepID=UPI001E40CCCD|nr:ThiF family adenylyltransferase [Microtetraspora sp. AC03309]MCC5581787.1 ThiF family adenylyltransferase [Microtetraspora sp. AC03309]